MDSLKASNPASSLPWRKYRAGFFIAFFLVLIILFSSWLIVKYEIGKIEKVELKEKLTIAADGVLTLAAGITRDTEWDSESEVETAWGGTNIIIGTEIDTKTELETLIGDTLLLDDGDTATGDYDFTGAEFLGASPLVFEGLTNNGITTTFAITDPTLTNKIITFKNETGTVAFLSDFLWESGTNGSYEDDAAVIVGPDVAPTLSNPGFTLAGNNDLFVGDLLGVEGNIYTDGSFIAGNSLTLTDGAIVQSTGSALNINLGGAAGDDFIVNTNSLVVESDTGKVGIGTSSPTSKLHVETSAWNNSEVPMVSIINMDSNFVDSRALFVKGGANNTQLTIEVQDYSGNTDFVITGIGNVGIGTASPAQKLTLVGGSFEIDNNRAIRMKDAATGSARNVLYVDSGDDIIFGDANYDDLLISVGSATNAMVIKQTTGNVGIGTVAPDGVLEVNMGTNKEMRLSYNDADGSAIDYSKFEVGDDGALTITTVDNDAAEGDILLMPDGNVGIGLTNPLTKLHVVEDATTLATALSKVATFSGGDSLTSGEILVRITTDAGAASGEYFLAMTSDVDGGSADRQFNFQTNGTAKADGSWTGGGADYAEWFKSEEEIPESSLIGLNLETGKVRVWREGDPFIGVQSINPGFVGNNLEAENSREDMVANGYVLVGLVGQITIIDNVINEDGIVYTTDGQFIGYRLSDGKVLLQLGGQIEGNALSINDLNGMVDSQQIKIESLGNLGKNLGIDLAHLGVKVDGTTEDLDSIEAILKVSRVEISDIKNDISGINTKLGNLELDISKLQTAIKNKYLEGDYTFAGRVFFEDKVSFNQDTAGKTKIVAGETTIRVNFTKPFEKEPVVNVTPLDFLEGQYKIEVEVNGFTIELSDLQAEPIDFSWTAFGLD